ncbi:acetate--CoA ligase family protein [Microbacterium sp. A93]|uniref:acetate--CoA ligase family protein n=1 Tax=Microbacterium sp. A93 TaxID=3450716 RepID=UPI003F437324
MSVIRADGVGALLQAKSIAIIGASDDPTRIGGRPLAYLVRAGFSGRIYPVNPNRTTIQGMPAFGSISELPETPDVAMIAVPASLTLDALKACAERGVRVAFIASAGFSETGEDGQRAQDELLAVARAAGMRLLGPNCLGAFNSETGFFPTFATAISRDLPVPGPIGVVSQSGAYGAHAVYLAHRRGIGVRYMVTTGNEADVDIADAIAWMASRPEVEVILAYAEGISDGSRFIEALRLAQETGTKIVLLKVGTSDAGARAAQSHTNSLAGADEVLEGICAQYGVYRATSAEEQIDVVYALAKSRPPRGRRLGVVSVSGGAGVHICDAAERFGLEVPTLGVETQRSILDLLPYASATNPVDVTAQSLQKVELLSHALRGVLESGEVDILIAYFTTTLLARAFSDVLKEAILSGTAGLRNVPMILVMVADPEIIREFTDAGFLVYEDSERAVRAIAAAQWLWEDRPVGPQPATPAEVRLDGPFTEYTAGQILADAGVPMLPQQLARTAEEAILAADRIGYPLAMKICSPDLQHKSDIGGVALGVSSADDVRVAFAKISSNVAQAAPDAQVDGVLLSPMAPTGVEVVIGLVDDPVFGPVVMAGLGGVLVEVLGDVSFRLAPIDEHEATRMLDALGGRKLLDGVRGAPPSDVAAVSQAIAALSQFGASHRGSVATAEVNPLLALPDGAIGLDAVIVNDHL